MNLRILFSALAVTMLGFCSQGIAQTYTLGYDRTSYSVAEGSTVDIDIILTEEITGAEMSRLAAGGDDGLFAFGASVDFSAFTGTGSGATFSAFALDPEFSDADAQVGGGLVEGSGEVSFEGVEDFGLNSDGEDGVGGTMISSSIYEIRLGTITFNAGSAGTITTIQLQDHTDTGAVPFLFADGAQPAIVFGSGQIVSVPEPGSATALALLAGVGLLRRRRK